MSVCLSLIGNSKIFVYQFILIKKKNKDTPNVYCSFFLLTQVKAKSEYENITLITHVCVFLLTHPTLTLSPFFCHRVLKVWGTFWNVAMYKWSVSWRHFVSPIGQIPTSGVLRMCRSGCNWCVAKTNLQMTARHCLTCVGTRFAWWRKMTSSGEPKTLDHFSTSNWTFGKWVSRQMHFHSVTNLLVAGLKKKKVN